MKRVAAGALATVIVFAVGFGIARHGRTADRQPKDVTTFSTTYTIWQVDPPASPDSN
jgi:hypothetical protein